MVTKQIDVRVQRDHLERMTGVRKPALALAELVWNGFDADATEVRVEFRRDYTGGIESVRVVDNGHGIAHRETETAFGYLGGSWKQTNHRTHKGRLLHGRDGEGRFRAFGLGDRVEWHTVYEEAGMRYGYTITGDRAALGTFKVSEPQPSTETATGTQVEVKSLIKKIGVLDSAAARQEFCEYFALYLQDYPGTTIYYDEVKIDPAQIASPPVSLAMEPVEVADGRVLHPELLVIEWTTQAERQLVLCDGAGFALSRVPPKFQAPGFNFTAYLKTDFLRELDTQNALDLDELQPDLRKLVEAARAVLRNHFRRRAAELASGLVDEWNAIINAAKTVAERLDFLRGLELLVFDPQSRQQLLERSQLHRILANHTWIFGEAFNLTVDDQSLTEVLKKHLEPQLKRKPDDLAPVRRSDGTAGIVDLMLSRRIPLPRAEEREHLVIELKRPNQRITPEIVMQIEGYAFAVAQDERFRDTKTRWTFWVISNEIDDQVRRLARQANRPEGMLHVDEDLRITIWTRTWSQVIEEGQGRLSFFKERLEYTADRGSALEYLRRTHEKYLPPALLTAE